MVNLTPWTRLSDESGTGLLNLRSEVDRLFDQMFEHPRGMPRQSTMWAPAIEVFDEKDQLVVRAEVPGMNADDIDISIDGDELVISGEKREESQEEHGGVYRSEIRYGRFHRSIALPNNVDPESIDADYDNGILTVHIPRTEPKQPKKIQVKNGGSRKIRDAQRSERSGDGQERRGQSHDREQESRSSQRKGK